MFAHAVFLINTAGPEQKESTSDFFEAAVLLLASLLREAAG